MKKFISVFLLVFTLLTTSAIAKPRHTSKHVYDYYSAAIDEGTKIKFILGNKTFDIQGYNLAYYTAPPDKSSPLTAYQINTFSINIRTSKIDQELLDWLISPDQQLKEAQIIVIDGDTGKTIRKISFTGVKTGSYSESNNSNFANNQVTNLNLRYQTISIKL